MTAKARRGPEGATDPTPLLAKGAKGRTPLSRGFYAAALSEAEAELLAAAREVPGLDEEIALLRLRLRRLVEERPEQTELLFKGVGLLVRAVAARYRLAPEAEENLFQSLEAVVRSVGGAVGSAVGSLLGGDPPPAMGDPPQGELVAPAAGRPEGRDGA